VTWSRRNATPTNWTTAGGSFLATPTASETVSTTNVNSWISWNVTADVSAYASGEAVNYGWLIKDAESVSTSDKWQYRTREYSSGSLSPKLEINYTAIPEPAEVALGFGLVSLVGMLAHRRMKRSGAGGAGRPVNLDSI